MTSIDVFSPKILHKKGTKKRNRSKSKGKKKKSQKEVKFE